MLYATELMGAQAYDVQGNYVGRVREFFVEPAEQPNRVAHFLISRGRFQPLVARYDQVSAVEPGRVQLNVSERALAAYEPNEGWLAVQKDLLDQQIIDTEGRKVVRVNDVDLAELRTNGNVELRIAQVDVGLPGAVRRLLQGVAPAAMVRRLQKKLPQRSIRPRTKINSFEDSPMPSGCRYRLGSSWFGTASFSYGRGRAGRLSSHRRSFWPTSRCISPTRTNIIAGTPGFTPRPHGDSWALQPRLKSNGLPGSSGSRGRIFWRGSSGHYRFNARTVEKR